eukprot:TRINITY_DN2578_c0_g1_i1.p1 TRINITY_DN2578_c0_g1~~TRINITY_DN2578_c0_g1_i1.p1  ORF type:complete len:1340 (+),score=195.52 TRINITY_DN2578_c0_g1_i1:1195-5214(+)
MTKKASLQQVTLKSLVISCHKQKAFLSLSLVHQQKLSRKPQNKKSPSSSFSLPASVAKLNLVFSCCNRRLEPSGIDITSLSASKEITKTESCLEFLLISLSRAFALQPKQAAGLLTDGSQYLAHILIKGLKGEYPPVESFLMEVYAASKHFTNLMKREEGGTTEMVLNMLKGGLYSKSKEVVTWTLKVLSKIAYDLSALELNKSAWEWFIAVDGGLDGAVYAMQKHAEVHNTAIEMMLNFGKQNIIELFTQFLKNVINDNGKYWKLVNTFIKPLSDQKGAGEEAFQKCIESVLSHWFDSAIRIAENDGRHSIQDRVVALSVLCEIWINSPTVAESKEDLAEKSLSVLRRATRDKSQALQFYVLAQLFNLLELFATEKKPYAPTLYKSLAFSFLEMHPQEDIREFILANLSALYTQMPAVPVSIVVEPLVRQVETSENVTYFFNLTDFDFLGLVAVHPKLSLKSGLQLLDMFARLTLNDPIFSIIALQNFVKIAERFATDPSVAEFITKFVTVRIIQPKQQLALNTLHNNIKKYYKKRPANPKGKPVQRPKAVRELEALEKEERILAGSNAQKIVDTLVCIQALNHEEINSLIRDTVLELYEKIKSQFGKPYEPLKALLTAYGLPNEIIAEFEEKKRQEQLERERAEQEAIERERKQKEEEMEKKKAAEMEKPKSQKRSHSQQKADNQLALVPVEKQRSSSKQYQIVPYQPQTDLGQKALVDIERIKKVKEEREARVFLNRTQQNRNNKLRNRQNQEQRRKRSLFSNKSFADTWSLDLCPRQDFNCKSKKQSTKNLADHLLLQEGSLDREIVRAKTGNFQSNIQYLIAAEIELTNLDEEEPGDKEAIELMMKKHRKLFRYLFGKYANTCYAHKAKVFDSLRNKSELITIAEFRKMLNDHKVDQSEVSREELIVLFRLVNTKHKRSDIQTLTFEGFVECFMQLAIYLHNKSHQSAACVPLVESINKLISQFEEATQKRGENTIMYINPEAAALFAEDQELLKELNAMIEKSPNYPLPEGFKKTQIKEIKYVHSLKTFPASEPVKISVELIDEILNKALGVHFIEPRAVYEYRTKVVPDTLKGRNSTINTSHFPTKYSEITRSKPKSIQLEQLEEPKRPRLDFTLPKPKVSVATRLVIAAMPKELHDIGLEVGAVVEELVKAVEEGKTSLRPKGGEIMNKAMKERQELLEEIAKAEKEKEEKRKQRQQQLKKVLEEKKRMKTKAEPTKEQAEKKSKEQWEKELEELRKRVEERAEKRKEEKQKQLEEIETKQREEKEKRLKELEPFVKKRKEELVSLYTQHIYINIGQIVKRYRGEKTKGKGGGRSQGGRVQGETREGIQKT